VALLGLSVPVVYRRSSPPVKVLLASVGLGVLPATILLGYVGSASARYTADISPALTLVGTLALMYWASRARPGLRRLSAAAALAWSVSIVFGVMLGVGVWLYSFPQAAREAQSASYTLTDLVAWRLAAAHGDKGYVENIQNANGGWETSNDGQRFFWVGAGDAVVDVLVTKAGVAHLTATIFPGPSLPETDLRKIQVSTTEGYGETVVTQGKGSLDLLIPLAPGGADIHLRAVDKPSLSKLPNGDARPLLARVQNLTVDVP
jgi:hypothetical protein